MAAESKKEIELEIAHVLFIDIVGYSKSSLNEQHAVVEQLTQIVRATEQFQKADISQHLFCDEPPTATSSLVATAQFRQGDS